MLWLDVRGLVQIDACPAGVWVRLAFTSPVAVTGSTSYVVSIDNLDQYTATGDGHYQIVHVYLTMRAGARQELACVHMHGSQIRRNGMCWAGLILAHVFMCRWRLRLCQPIVWHPDPLDRHGRRLRRQQRRLPLHHQLDQLLVGLPSKAQDGSWWQNSWQLQ